ncbi:hypothetical protein Hamer_G017733 [Homarus americanus]|uniref:Uncharacterized protein n=1 Tax=Homarus americanus TaxID=6706 RepID=A0A8J5JIU4_HOMAM|nr:hypothetical protein Hamer_G017733 [Homarus americanus]
MTATHALTRRGHPRSTPHSRPNKYQALATADGRKPRSSGRVTHAVDNLEPEQSSDQLNTDARKTRIVSVKRDWWDSHTPAARDRKRYPQSLT